MFQHEEEGHLLWEGIGDFSATDVHKQVAISFRTPPYKLLNVSRSFLRIQIKVQMVIIFSTWKGGGTNQHQHSFAKAKRRSVERT